MVIFLNYGCATVTSCCLQLQLFKPLTLLINLLFVGLFCYNFSLSIWKRLTKKRSRKKMKIYKSICCLLFRFFQKTLAIKVQQSLTAGSLTLDLVFAVCKILFFGLRTLLRCPHKVCQHLPLWSNFEDLAS